VKITPTTGAFSDVLTAGPILPGKQLFQQRLARLQNSNLENLPAKINPLS